MLKQESRNYGLFFITITLAFCSIVYELLIGQSLAAFLGGTVRQYCITIGLYMFSMGIGAMITEGKLTKHPIFTLQIFEIFLAIVGGTSLVFLYIIHSAGLAPLLLSTLSYSPIIVIGILTGAEIPLLIAIHKKNKGSAQTILGIDYFGALLGTLAFAFIFYSELGLFLTSFLTASLNAMAGILLIEQKEKNSINSLKKITLIPIILLAILTIMAIKNTEISGYFTNYYLNAEK